jgi:hypothetical protein
MSSPTRRAQSKNINSLNLDGNSENPGSHQEPRLKHLEKKHNEVKANIAAWKEEAANKKNEKKKETQATQASNGQAMASSEAAKQS